MRTFSTAEQLFPIYQVEHGCMISAMGDLTIGYELTLPEIFTLSEADYENLHQSWISAIKLLPAYTILHKQDIFQRDQYVPDTMGNKSFLTESAGKHFRGRPFLAHRCYLYLTRKAADRKQASSAFSGLLRKRIVPRQTTEAGLFTGIQEKAGQFESVLRANKNIKLRRLTDEELAGTKTSAGVIEQYCFLLRPGEQPMLKDVRLKEGLRIGNDCAQLFTLAEATDLPSVCGSRITYDPFSTDQTSFPVGFPASLNLFLNCNHIYNQYIFIEDQQKTLKQLEARKLRLQSLSAYSRENAISRDATNDFLNEAIGKQRLPVKAHFNVLAWTDNKDALQDIRNQVSAAIALTGGCARLESDGAAQIWWAGIPGNAADFPMNDTFDTLLEQAICFLNAEGNASSDPITAGIRFCERLSGRPVYVDLFDLPRKRGITSNMGMLVCGESGGGKSMTINHILRSLHEQGAHCVTVDIGGSYRGLCELTGGYYFTYSEKDPIRFNPFYIAEGDLPDTEKSESLKALLVALWKQENDGYNRSEYIALSNALSGYYRLLNAAPALFPCFDTFYEYLEGPYREVLKGQKVKDRDFDIDNFLYVLRPYYHGGEFDYLLNARENLDLLHQPFIVIELDNIKDHPILFPVVTLIIMEMFISKMRKLKGTRKVLTIDEAWKAIAKSGMAEFLKYAFKTIRKFNGVPIVITQELDDLVSSPIIKDAIINNADIKILFDMKKYQGKFDKLQNALGLSESAKTQLLSVNKDQRELFIGLGSQQSRVLINELSREEYYAYTTEGRERVLVQEYAHRHGSMQAGIAALVLDEKKQTS